MKTLLPLFLFLGGMHLLQAQLTLTDSLVAWYPMDGNAADSSGNGNHGTPFGAVLTADRSGNPNAAYEFDGTDDYLSLTANQKMHPDFPISIAAWIKMDDLNHNNIFQNEQDSTNYYGFWLSVVMNGRLTLTMGDGGFIGPNWRRTKVGNSVLTTGTWYHVAGVARSATDMDLYINGKNDCGYYEGTGNTTVAYSGDDGTSGRSTGEQYFHGAIDDLRFYKRELSEEEIRILADFPSQDTVICLGDSVQLDAGYGSLLSWTPTNSLSCTNCKDPFAFPSMATNYLAITSNSAGCTDSVQIQVDITNCSTDPCDTVDLQANFQYSVSGQNVFLTDLSTGSDLDQIKWSFGDGNFTNFNNPGSTLTHPYAMPGTYEVCVYAMDFNGEQILCSDTLCQFVEIRADTCDSYQADFSYNLGGATLSVIDNSTPPIQDANWDFGDGNVASTTGSGSGAIHTYSTLDTTYTVCLEIIAYPDSQTTCRDTICKQISLTTSLEEDLTTQGWSVFPNPSTGKIQVRLAQASMAPGTLVLHDLSGKVVFRKALLPKKEQGLVLPKLSPGVYLLQIQGTDLDKNGFQKLILR
jgi:PKD repeat protein